MLWADAKINHPAAVEKMLNNMTGLLPILSESDPRKGLLKNAQKEKIAKRNVIRVGDAPNSSK